MARKKNTINEDLETLREALDVLVEHGTAPKRDTQYVNDPTSRYGYSKMVYVDNPNNPQRLPHTVTDPLFIAQWALERVLDQLALKARPDIGALAEAALAKADKEAKMMIGLAGQAAVRIRADAKKEAQAEAKKIIALAEATVKQIDDAIERRVEERIQQMYGIGSGVRRPRRFRIAHGKRLALVDDKLDKEYA